MFFMQSQTRWEIVYDHTTRREQWLGQCLAESLPCEIQAILVQNKYLKAQQLCTHHVIGAMQAD